MTPLRRDRPGPFIGRARHHSCACTTRHSKRVTRSQRDSDAPETIHFCRCGLETADPRSEAADPLPKESFYHALRVRCDYQTRYSYFYSCTLYCRSTADLTLQISTHRWTPSTSTLKSLSSHRPGGALDRPTGSGDCRSEIFCL